VEVAPRASAKRSPAVSADIRAPSASRAAHP
jgi:hypothetical protein